MKSTSRVHRGIPVGHQTPPGFSLSRTHRGTALQNHTDILVLGAGSAGRYAARAASSMGKNVTLVESGPFGGLCILKGCMPSKALLRPAHVFHLLSHRLAELGLVLNGEVKADISAIVRIKNSMIGEMADDALQSIQKNDRIRIANGPFTFSGPQSGHLDGQPVSFEKAVIATGSRIRIPAIPGLDRDWILTSDDILELESLPKSVLVLGAGPVGLELGQYLFHLGSSVTVVDTKLHWHPHVDRELGLSYINSLSSQGMRILLGARDERFETDGPVRRFIVGIEGKTHTIPFEKIFVATGRRPETESLNLHAARVDVDRHGHVHVDACLRTTNPHIFAAGDVTGILPVLNLATYHGEHAGRNTVLTVPVPVPERPVPIAIFTDPEYARVGLTESQARDRNIPVMAGRIAFGDVGKAIVNRQTEGGLKIVANARTREILGAEMYGEGASELIHIMTVALHFRATIDQYHEILHIHPTLSETFKYLIDEMTDSL